MEGAVEVPFMEVEGAMGERGRVVIIPMEDKSF